MYKNVLFTVLVLAAGLGCSSPSVPQQIAHMVAPKEPETLKRRMDAYNRAHPAPPDLGYTQMMNNLGGYTHPVTKGGPSPKPLPPIVWTAKGGRTT